MHVRENLGVSERRACHVLGQARATQRYAARARDDEDALTGAVIELATTYGRYGYRIVWGLLRLDGWFVNHKRVERIWRQEGLNRYFPDSIRIVANRRRTRPPMEGISLCGHSAAPI